MFLFYSKLSPIDGIVRECNENIHYAWHKSDLGDMTGYYTSVYILVIRITYIAFMSRILEYFRYIP